MSGQRHYRSFQPDLQVRSQGDGRTIYGIVVPYNAPTRIEPGLIEQWSPGSFDHQMREPSRVRLSREHIDEGGTLIGAGSLMRDDSAGLYMELRASNTPTGNETLELVKDGALRQLSIAFRERQNRALPGGITERVSADLEEVAVVLTGAFGDLAPALGVRSAQTLGQPLDDEEAAILAAYERYSGGLRDLPDHDTNIRLIQLGLSRI